MEIGYFCRNFYNIKTLCISQDRRTGRSKLIDRKQISEIMYLVSELKCLKQKFKGEY